MLALLSSAIFIASWASRLNPPRNKGLLHWGIGYALIGSGFCVLALPAARIDFPYLVLCGNLLIDVGTVLTLLGVAAYFQRLGWELWALLPAAVLASVEISLVLSGGENYRVMVPFGAGARAIVTIATATMLWRCSDEASRLAARSSSLFHLAWAAMLALRIGWWFAHPSMGAGADPTSTFGLLSRLLLTWAITPTYLWMLSRELDAELIRHARQDPLTGIANRRVMWAEGEKWVETVDRKGRYMAVVIIDLDHFKAVNDNWGHAAGDEVLVGVAHTLARHKREEDLLARIGGEEFMVLIRHEHRDLVKATNAIEAIAERLRQAIEKQEFSFSDSDILKCTASIGYAVSQRGQSHWSTVVEAADKALYDAKRNGRNQVRGSRVGPNRQPPLPLGS